MADPLMREADHDSPLTQAVRRLEQALQRLEGALSAGGGHAPPTDTGRTQALVVELDAARRRQSALVAAAASASAALGRAAADVRRTLDEDAERQGLFDFAEAEQLESDDASPEEGQADDPTAEEPAA
jgi:hypothetical protein